jgi:hypothetical protein
MRTRSIASLLFLAAAIVPACADDGETCADGDCSAGGSTSGPATTTTGTGSTSSTGQGGSGGGGEPLHTEVVFTSNIAGEPLAGETVVVNAADGSVVSQTVTDADGTAPVEIPAGGSVSVFYSLSYWFQGTEYQLRHAQTVYPGDAQPARIALQDGGFLEAEPGPGLMGIGVTWDLVIGAAEYLVGTNCFSLVTPAPALQDGAWTNNCTNDGLYDVVIAARDVDGGLLDYAVLPDQPFMDQTKLNHDMVWANGGQVADIPYAVTNVDDNADYAQARSVATRNTHGAPISLEQLVTHGTLTGPEVSGTVGHAVGFGDKHCTTISVTLPASQRVAYSRCGMAPDLTPITFDAGRLTRFTTTGQTTPTTVAWAETAQGELGDLLMASVRAELEDPNLGITWTAIVAPGAGSAMRPDLPPGLEDYAFSAVNNAFVQHVDLHDAAGFQAALEEASLWSSREVASHD